MELGPIQKEWIITLREHPERQHTRSLGKKNDDGTFKACCLGQGGLISGVCKWSNNNLLVTVHSFDEYYLLATGDYKSLGLIDSHGSSKNNPTQSLAQMNDSGVVTWPEIADMLESNPDEWFTHSV